MSEQMIPITLRSGMSTINIVCDQLKITWPAKAPDAYFAVVVVDRTTLTTVFCEYIDDLSTVPESLKKYDGNSEYFLFIVTFSMNNSNIPSGDFLSFIDKNGSGPGLAKCIQCANSINKTFGYYSYCLASTMGTETGFENYLVNTCSPSSDNIFLPLKLDKFGDKYLLVNTFPK